MREAFLQMWMCLGRVVFMMPACLQTMILKVFKRNGCPRSVENVHLPVPPVLLGDSAYSLLPNLMKEYSHCSRNEDLMFNQMLRAARSQIERAFGRLKAR